MEEGGGVDLAIILWNFKLVTWCWPKRLLMHEVLETSFGESPAGWRGSYIRVLVGAVGGGRAEER